MNKHRTNPSPGSGSQGGAVGPSLSRRKKLLFALLPVVALLLFAELAIRAVRAPFHLGSFRSLRVDLIKRGYPAVPDGRLGYVPAPNFASADNHWGTRVSIDANGFRRNGEGPPPPGEGLIVAVGDSFTFGDQVDDDASWPAQLEHAIGRPVVNAGVFGYSFTQVILRAELLLEQLPVHTLVVSFISGDLERCEYSKRYTPVPWFDLEQGRLVLRNSPVVDTSRAEEVEQRWIKDALGCSALLDGILAHACRQWWIEDEKHVQVPHLVGMGPAIGSLLVQRIGAAARAHGVRLLLVLQGAEATAGASAVLATARASGIATLDLVDEFLAAERVDPTLRQRWFDGHMTREGNGWVAQRIAETLRGGG